jgi:hypothetical protein
MNHAVAQQIVLVDDDVAEVDPHAEDDAPFRRHPRLIGGDGSDGNRAPHRVDHGGELHQRAIAHQLDDAALVLRDERLGGSACALSASP